MHMPVVVRNLGDNQAVIAMVDSNLQREHLKPSEKAFAYKMKLEAMKRQGARTDELLAKQVGENRIYCCSRIILFDRRTTV